MPDRNVSLGDILAQVVKTTILELSPDVEELLKAAKEQKIGVSVEAQEVLGDRRVKIVFDGVGDYESFRDNGYIPRLQTLFPQCHTVNAAISNSEPQYMGWHQLSELQI